MIRRDVLEILACPRCKVAVRLQGEAQGGWLVCIRCGRRYPVRDGIPAMRIEDGIPPAAAPSGDRPVC